MQPKEIIASWDFILSILISIILWLICPNQVDGLFAKDIYNVAISVLSIIFSMLFATLAIIISSSDNDFVNFLEEEGHYTGIINLFKYSLFVLFIALILSLILFGITSSNLSVQGYTQPKIIIIMFNFLFLYSLFVVFSTSLNTITYLKYRIKYLKIKNYKK